LAPTQKNILNRRLFIQSNSLILSHLPRRGLEPLTLSGPDPKSGASANFATSAFKQANDATIGCNDKGFFGFVGDSCRRYLEVDVL
jgi:hypothetical protein